MVAAPRCANTGRPAHDVIVAPAVLFQITIDQQERKIIILPNDGCGHPL
jgi:hypothetical protein